MKVFALSWILALPLQTSGAVLHIQDSFQGIHSPLSLNMNCDLAGSLTFFPSKSLCFTLPHPLTSAAICLHHKKSFACKKHKNVGDMVIGQVHKNVPLPLIYCTSMDIQFYYVHMLMTLHCQAVSLLVIIFCIYYSVL